MALIFHYNCEVHMVSYGFPEFIVKLFMKPILDMETQCEVPQSFPSLWPALPYDAVPKEKRNSCSHIMMMMMMMMMVALS